jgi:hypothetical protein
MSRQPSSDERRQHRRVPAALPFRLLYDGKEEVFDLVDLSESGARIRCRHHIPPMTRIAVKLLLPGARTGGDGDVRFDTGGVVVWSHKQPHAPTFDTGLFFSDLDDPQRELLRAFVKAHA